VVATPPPRSVLAESAQNDDFSDRGYRFPFSKTSQVTFDESVDYSVMPTTLEQLDPQERLIAGIVRAEVRKFEGEIPLKERLPNVSIYQIVRNKRNNVQWCNLAMDHAEIVGALQRISYIKYARSRPDGVGYFILTLLESSEEIKSHLNQSRDALGKHTKKGY
jgi:hypothetical protein